MTRRPWICATAVVLVALSAMGRCVLNEFVMWDDPKTISQNSLCDPPTGKSLATIWTTPAQGLYVPVTYSAWWTIASITGKPLAFHLTSVVAHAMSALLVFFVLRRLNFDDIASCFGAMIFAVHPLQVEPVAWASGLKDVLAGVLALAAILAHLSHSHRGKVFAILLFILAILAKPSAASVIPIAFIADTLMLRRCVRASLGAVFPYLLIALPLITYARIVQETPFVPHVEFWKRPLVACDAMTFYLTKLFAPIRLAIDYGRTPAVAIASKWIALRSTIPIALIFVCIRSRVLLASVLIIVAGLIWNLGLTPFQFQMHSTVADHYMYLAMLGPALATSFLVAKWKPTRIVLLLAILVLAALSIRQTFVWEDSEKLFRHAIAMNPRSVASHENLGRLLGERGDLSGAEAEFLASLDVSPDNPETLRNLAVLKYKQKDFNAAMSFLFRAIQLNDARGQDVSKDIGDLMQLRNLRDRAASQPSQ